MTDSELVLWLALKYVERKPATQPAVDIILGKLFDGTLVPASQAGFGAAVADIQGFITNLQTVSLPALSAQIAAVAARNTPLPPPP